MPSLRPVAPAAILAATLTMLLACSDRAAQGRSDAVVVVTAPGTTFRQHLQVVAAKASPAMLQEELANPETDLAIEPPEAVVALRDADPYRIADADLPPPDNAGGEDFAT